MISTIFLVFFSFASISPTSAQECSAPYWEFIPTSSLPSDELQVVTKDAAPLPFFMKELSEGGFLYTYSIFGNRAVLTYESGNLTLQKLSNTSYKISGEGVGVMVESNLSIAKMLMADSGSPNNLSGIEYVGKAAFMFNPVPINHSKAIYPNNNFLNFEAISYQTQNITFNSYVFDPKPTPEQQQIFETVMAEQLFPAVQNFLNNQIYGVLSAITRNQTYRTFNFKSSNYTYKDVDFNLNTSVSSVSLQNSLLKISYNMSDLTSPTPLCTNHPSDEAQDDLYLSPEFFKYFVERMLSQSIYFNPLTLTTQNSSIYFQMFLCYLEDIIPSTLSISQNYSSHIITQCKVSIPLFQTTIGGSNFNLGVEWRCMISHQSTQTDIIEVVSKGSYKSSVIRKPNFFRILLTHYHIESNEWRQANYQLTDETLANIFIESYLKESVGIITLDEKEISSEERREE